MTTTISAINPIQGLLDYIEDVKPYHTKVVEILTEYVHAEDVAITMSETFSMDIKFLFPTQQELDDILNGNSNESNRFGGFGGTTTFGTPDPAAWPVIPFNFTATGPFDPAYMGYNSTTNQLIIPGDRTAQYTVGRSIKVVMYNNTTLPFIEIDSTTYSITNVQYNLPTNSNETPHTTITVSGLTDESTIQAANGGITDEQTYVTVSLTPFQVSSIVFGYAGATQFAYTDVPPSGTSPSPSPDPYSQISASSPDETLFSTTPIRVNSFVVDNADVTQVFVTGSILELTSTGELYRVLYSVLDGTDSIIRVVETIPANTNIAGASLKVREQIPGYDDSFLTSAESGGTLSTVITDRISFSWSDPGENDVLYGYQYLIQSTTGSTITVNGTNLEFEVSVGDDIQIFDNAAINGIYQVTAVSGANMTVTPALTSSQGGFVEKYEP